MTDDFEIRKDKDGRIFGIRNMRFDATEGTIIADISGDYAAARDYMNAYVKKLYAVMNLK